MCAMGHTTKNMHTTPPSSQLTEKNITGFINVYRISTGKLKLHDLETARMENAQPGKYQNGKCTTWKMTENAHPGK